MGTVVPVSQAVGRNGVLEEVAGRVTEPLIHLENGLHSARVAARMVCVLLAVGHGK